MHQSHSLNPRFPFWILSHSFGEKSIFLQSCNTKFGTNPNPLIFLQSCETKPGMESLGSRLLISRPGHLALYPAHAFFPKVVRTNDIVSLVITTQHFRSLLVKWGYVVTQARLSPSSVERSERNTISELIAVLYTDHSAPEILFTSPTLSLPMR